jgi:hypothetical protein
METNLTQQIKSLTAEIKEIFGGFGGDLADLPLSSFDYTGKIPEALRLMGYDESATRTINNNRWWGWRNSAIYLSMTRKLRNSWKKNLTQNKRGSRSSKP